LGRQRPPVSGANTGGSVYDVAVRHRPVPSFHLSAAFACFSGVRLTSMPELAIAGFKILMNFRRIGRILFLKASRFPSRNGQKKSEEYKSVYLVFT
jgi:hypothetical protein